MKLVLLFVLSFFIFSCQNPSEENKQTTSQVIPTGTSRVTGINCFKDYDAGLAFARKEKKPILLNFTGYANVNSRKLEDLIWANPQVHSILENNFVVINLYTDDKKELPREQQFKSPRGKDIKTLGNKWLEMEIVRYQNDSQPCGVIIDCNEKLIAGPIGYIPDSIAYSDFLESGLNGFQKK